MELYFDVSVGFCCLGSVLDVWQRLEMEHCRLFKPQSHPPRPVALRYMARINPRIANTKIIPTITYSTMMLSPKRPCSHKQTPDLIHHCSQDKGNSGQAAKLKYGPFPGITFLFCDSDGGYAW